MSIRNLATCLLFGILGAAPLAAHACACCGIENTWNVKVLKPNTYEWEELTALKPGLGKFIYECPGCHEEKKWDIVSASRDGMTFRFKTANGAVVFRGTRRVEYRQTDISFAVQPPEEHVEMANIYHELVITGTAFVSGAMAAPKASDALRATLVLRGVGSMCFDRETFQKWLLRAEPREGVDPEDGNLVGSGVLVSPLR
jgi:hypothetical protein